MGLDPWCDWDEGDYPLVPARPTSPQRPIVAADLTWLRQQTNQAKGPGGDNTDGSWSDAALTNLLQQFIVVPRPQFRGSAWPAPTDPAGYEPDLWAGAALALEYRLLAFLEHPSQGATMVRDGDAYQGYKETTSATLLLRSIIKRCWRRADQYNRQVVHPSGWRTVDVGTAKRYALLNVRARLGLVVNGPDLLDPLV